jgi:hypothetical protein
MVVFIRFSIAIGPQNARLRISIYNRFEDTCNVRIVFHKLIDDLDKVQMEIILQAF